MADYDSPWKEALDIFFEAFLKLFFPQAHDDIDWGRAWESKDKELQQIAPEAEIGRRYVDKLVKVWLKSGEEQWVLIHIEVQMGQEGKFTWRMYVYNCGVFLKYNKKVASFAVLGDDSPSWRPDSYAYALWGTEVSLRFPIVKLLDYGEKRADLEESDNPFATVVLAHLDAQETRQDLGQRKDRKFGLVRRLLERGWDAERVRQLFNLVDWLMELPRDLKIEFRKQVTQYEEEKQMPFINTFEEIGFDKGFDKGMQRGLGQGRDEGFAESIATVLEARFPAACGQLMSEIAQVHDHEQLKKILRAAATVAGPDELRKLWANGSDRDRPQE